MSLWKLLVVIVGFSVGIGIESLFDVSLYSIVWLSLLALVVAVLWRRAPASTCPAPQLVLISAFLIFCSLGILRTQVYEQKFTDSLASLVGQETTFTGVVKQEPDRRTKQQFLTVAHGDTLIRVSAERDLLVSYGDKVEVTGQLKRPETFETDLGRTFNYQAYLQAKGIEYTVSFAEVEVVDRGMGNPIISRLLKSKQVFMSRLDQVLTEPAGALADGLLLGLNQGLGEKLEEDFRRSGIVHIVVLSGYNIMLVVTFVMFILSFFLRQRWRMVVGLISIVCFALIVGLSATVVRASIMASLLLIAETLGRRYDVLRALLLAGFSMLVFNPYLLLFDIGFQLSFMATLGLIAVLPWLKAKEQPEVLTSVRGYMMATIATQIAVLPLLIYHIGEVSVVAVLVNILVLPAVPLAMFGSFISVVFYSLIPTIGLVFGSITQVVLSYIILVAEQFSALSIATITFSEIPAWVVGVMYLVIGYLYWWFLRRPKSTSNVSDWQIVEEEVLRVGADKKSAPAKIEVPKMFR